MIEVEAITKSYGAREVLGGVSFRVAQGEVTGFLGANGAGKTTTMDIICGCKGADHGTVRIAGHDIGEEPVAAKRHLGYLPENPPLYRDMTVHEAVSYAARLRLVARSQVGQRVSATLERLDLTQVRDRLIGHLSKGFRQRIALAQAIVHNPPVLVLDEPTEGLDPQQIIAMRGLITELSSDHTLILSSHILSEVQQLCQRIVIINAGRVVEEGSYRELLAKVETDTVFELELARAGAAFLRDLPPLPGLRGARALAGQAEHIHVRLALAEADEALEALTRHAVLAGHGLRGLRRKTTSLEELFLNLTSRNEREAPHG